MPGESKATAGSSFTVTNLRFGRTAACACRCAGIDAAGGLLHQGDLLGEALGAVRTHHLPARWLPGFTARAGLALALGSVDESFRTTAAALVTRKLNAADHAGSPQAEPLSDGTADSQLVHTCPVIHKPACSMSTALLPRGRVYAVDH